MQEIRSGWRRQVGDFVLSDRVQNFVLIVIIFNALCLGLETSPRIVTAVGAYLHLFDLIALTIFVIEIVLKIIALDWRFIKDGWNIFDFIVVAIALIPSAGPLAVLRSLRVLRALRLVNRLPQLRHIADAMIKAIPGIGAIASLMVIVFYVGAVMATTLFGHSFPEWFGSVGSSLYTLFQVMTLESWSMGIVRPVMETYPYAWVFFVPFILISAFVMLNLFVAVIVDTMSRLNTNEEEDKDETESELAEIRRELAAIKTLLQQPQQQPEPKEPSPQNA